MKSVVNLVRTSYKVILVKDVLEQAEIVRHLTKRLTTPPTPPAEISAEGGIEGGYGVFGKSYIEELLEISNRQQIYLSKVESLGEAKQLLNQESFDVILLDISLTDSQVFDRFFKVQKCYSNTPIVVLTECKDEQLALQLLKAGAQDYLLKEKINGEVLIRCLRYAIERQHLQATLRQNEEKYRLVVENSLVGIAIVNLPSVQSENYGRIEVNDALCNLLGYSQSELSEKPWMELIHPDDYDSNFERFSQVLACEIDDYVLDLRLLKKDGQVVYVRVSLRTYRNCDRSINNLVVVILDISDRYCYEQQQKASQQIELALQRQAAAMAAAKDGIAMLNTNEEFIYVNEAYLKVYGYDSAEELLGKNWKFLHDETEIQRLGQEICPALQQNGYISTETIGRRRDGTTYPQEISLTKLSGGEIISIVRDITNRKQAEEALQKSQHFIQQIADASPNILYLYDLIEQRNIYANRSMAEVLGYTAEEIQQMGAAVMPTLMHPDDLAKLPESLQKFATAKEGDIIEFEYRMRHRDGSWRWLISRDTLFTRTSDGKAQQLLGTASDITSRKQSEIEIRLLLAATKAISESQDFHQALAVVLRLLCTNIGWDFGEAWIPAAVGDSQNADRDTVLEYSPGWYASDRTVEKFGCLSEKYTFAPGVGLPGRIWLKGQPEWIEDVTKDPIFLRSSIAASVGLKTCFGVPIRTSGEVLAVLVFFKETKSAKEPHLVELVNAVATQLGEYIQRKKTEAALLLSEKRLQLALSASSLGLWDWNISTGQTYFDPHWKKILGYEVEEIENNYQSWERLLHPEDLPRVLQILNDHLTGATPNYEVEFRMKSKSGDWKWISALGKVVERDESWFPVRMIGTNKDISDRKLAEVELLSTRARLQQLLDSSPAVIYSSKISGNYAATFVSDNVTTVIGYEAQRFLEDSNFWVNNIHPEDVESIFAQQSHLFEQGYQSYEYRFLHADGTYHWFRDDIRLLRDKAGNPIECVGCWIDISDRKQAESALQQAKEAAEAANRAKSEFIANMSHELRTPLNGILGYAQILKTNKNLSETQQANLTTIQQCGEHLLTLIEDILDISKIEARKMELHPTELVFSNFIKSITDFFQMRTAQKNITFTCKELSPLPCCVQADAKRLRQVLINLLGNAVKFTNSGEVTFKVGVIGNQPLPTYKIRFQVEDTGIGIEQSKLEEIFLPFHQVGASIDAIEGTGLGLSISQKLVQMMGGEIKVKSTLGKGSVFWFELDLPLAEGCDKLTNEEEKGRIVGFTGNKRKVLVADDNQLNRAILRNLLLPLGFEVQEAINGQDCLNKAVEFQPNVILIDLVMPEMDGFEVTRRLRQLPQLKDVVLLALSASVFETTKQESIIAGCDNFLSKPIQTAQLLERLRMELGIEWIYEEPSKAESPAASFLLPPSQETIATLLELAMLGDIEGILEETTRLENLELELTPFVTHLHQLAEGFQLKQIREFLKQYIDNEQ